MHMPAGAADVLTVLYLAVTLSAVTVRVVTAVRALAARRQHSLVALNLALAATGVAAAVCGLLYLSNDLDHRIDATLGLPAIHVLIREGTFLLGLAFMLIVVALWSYRRPAPRAIAAFTTAAVLLALLVHLYLDGRRTGLYGIRQAAVDKDAAVYYLLFSLFIAYTAVRLAVLAARRVPRLPPPDAWAMRLLVAAAALAFLQPLGQITALALVYLHTGIGYHTVYSVGDAGYVLANVFYTVGIAYLPVAEAVERRRARRRQEQRTAA